MHLHDSTRNKSALSSSARRQLEDAAKALHANSSGNFEEIYRYLFDEAIECGGLVTDGTRAKHPILSTARLGDSAVQSSPEERLCMDAAIDRICTDPGFRRRLKAAPLSALSSLGITMPVSAQELLQSEDHDDPDLLINAATAQTTTENDLAANSQEGVVAVAIGVTIVLSGVAVAVVVIIRRRRRKSKSEQIEDSFKGGDGGDYN
ncbi:hypothetical protein [Denitrobaculum tricleocarpae]|uniref:Uncharacterized protein n=1 Tax=Denitrobaculum tricleocarpae TaxID=2591009 RepID=A0A545TN07_9PROT|nr:hypothetical protein [Denitrobaculum tricleocarpae]TQV78576.1 hypothetical protein FKG95_18660 [Denitrobaculum tricleocarpae]